MNLEPLPTLGTWILDLDDSGKPLLKNGEECLCGQLMTSRVPVDIIANVQPPGVPVFLEDGQQIHTSNVILLAPGTHETLWLLEIIASCRRVLKIEEPRL